MARAFLLRQSYSANHKLYLYELTTEELVSLDHPSGVYTGSGGMYHCGQSATYFGHDGRIWANWQNASVPPQLIALDVETGEQVGTLLAADESLPARTMQSISYQSSDGQEIQGWLGVPEGEGPFPTILNMHGGPHATMTDTYSPSIQAWLDHGFAYLTINFRGSVGFGLDFRAKIEGNIGHWELEDMVAAHDWLVREKIADPNQIILYGGSYGAFPNLLGIRQTA